jgi:hypothetical protein
MSVSDARSQACAGSAQSLASALKLLEEALQLIDDHASRPELGARLQEVIDSLKSRIG